MRTTILLCVALVAAACEKRDPVADGANNVAAAPADVEMLPADESSATSTGELANGATEDEGAANAAVNTIPASFHGRWGLTPADCTSTLGDAKGLMIVSGAEMRFYESVARPAGSLEVTKNSVSGDFAFTGEGLSWKRHQALQLQDRKLVRTESAPMASFTYARCAA